MPWVIAGIAYTVLAVLLTWPVAAHLHVGLSARRVRSRAQRLDPLVERARGAVDGALVECAELLAGRRARWRCPSTCSASPWSARRCCGSAPIRSRRYSLVLLLSCPLTALATHGLACAIVRRHGPALLAGLIMGFSPYRVAQLPHVQMLLGVRDAARAAGGASIRGQPDRGAGWSRLARRG